MSISKIFPTTCICVFLSSLAFAQAPQTTPAGSPQGTPGQVSQGAPGGAPQGAAGGGAAMPQTKSFNIDEFFTSVDTNKDGYLTKEEFKAAGLTDRIFKTPPFCDPDGDGKISKKEMTECKLPEAIDMNKDGKLTLKEVLEFEKSPLGKERGPGEAKPE